MKLPAHVCFADGISKFLCMATQAQRDLRFYAAEQEKANGEFEDWKHKLELEDPKYKERARIATQMQDALQRRRTAKDAVALLTPFVDYVNSPQGAAALNQLREVLGKCRKQEEYFTRRTYRFRQLKEPDIPTKEGK